ncbi:hypothetical protein LCGC14_1737110 [marine sediment metagenome]|uniref:Uncharacterized protein n=1 Tax=marine sediment metagenome TaxID=412755 RepID=A0A0F9JN34_9ZZZZ
MTETNENPPDKPDLQQFTPEQIEEYCGTILNLCLVSRVDGERMLTGVQIIRHLQRVVEGPVLLNPEVAIGIRE